MPDDGPESGFTLLEVLVAVVIAGLALAALFSGAATGLRSSHVSRNTMEALSLARSHLAAVGHGGPLFPGVRSGNDGRGFSWQVRVAPLAEVPLAQADATSPSSRSPRQIVLFEVAVAESWSTDGGARRVELKSERIGEMAPSGP